jgi:hypothetical protein
VIYFCCQEKRRSAVRDYAPVNGLDLNGIDYLEVVDHEEPVLAERQRRLRVFFVKPPAAPLLARLQTATPANVRITGGERTPGIVTDTVELKPDGHLEVHVRPRGDFSTYTLALVMPNRDQPLEGLDPALATIDFSFKVECPSPFDCRAQHSCAAPAEPAPESDYLAKDYASFRQLLLDRLSALLPDWRERNPADLGITLVELLAYVGDYLSYRQDAIATEAYLGTARQRVSVRRHARLLDYGMHDGCNARAWVQVRLKPGTPAQGITLPRWLVQDSQGNWVPAEDEPVPGNAANIRRTQFATRLADTTLVSESDFERLVAQSAPEIFEPMHPVTLFLEHNDLPLYTWSDDRCCLPKGATKATLAKHCPNLQPGAVLIFKEVIGPKTGDPADADPNHRHAVRLTKVNAFAVTQRNDGTEIRSPLTDPITTQEITEIEWGAGDALPFPLCVSSLTDRGAHRHDVSIALGNIVLSDHGRTLPEPEPLGAVPASNPVLAPVSAQGCGQGDDAEPALTPPRFHPGLKEAPLTQVATIPRTQLRSGRRTQLAFDPDGAAAAVFGWDMEHVLPAIRLGDDRDGLWLPRRDLLSSDAFAPEFVAEIRNDGRAVIRFGDDENGMRPGEQTSFLAVYRVGNGARGNIGAEALTHLAGGTLLADARWIESISNPLPAAGGADPETLEQTRQYAPAAFRIQRRAVTPDDYAATAEKHPEVQRAAATLRWTGSWHTIFLTVDRLGGRAVDAAFEDRLRSHLEAYRMAGHDLEIDGPQFVALELEMRVCVEPDYFRSDVLAAMHGVFSSGTRTDGSRGFFHPDRFTFGQGVHLSELYAAAQPVAGVRHVDITVLQRLGAPDTTALDTGVLDLGRLEIARLDNDPNFPDRGQLRFMMKGGR